jgi:flagellar biosynthesis protein FliR
VAQYIQIGILLISVPNVIVIGLMVLIFGVALLLKLPSEREN